MKRILILTFICAIQHSMRANDVVYPDIETMNKDLRATKTLLNEYLTGINQISRERKRLQAELVRLRYLHNCIDQGIITDGKIIKQIKRDSAKRDRNERQNNRNWRRLDESNSLAQVHEIFARYEA